MSDYKAIHLKAGDCVLELVPEFGGLTNRLQFTPLGQTRIEVIAGLPNHLTMQEDQAYRGIPLFPFVNRLDAGRYTHQGQNYQLRVNETRLNNALHGFAYQMEPKLTTFEEGKTCSRASLQYDYKGSEPGYPFPVTLTIHYLLTPLATLDITYEVTNHHHESIPIGFGWHPYFQLGEDINNLHLCLKNVRRIAVDDRMLPTGEKLMYKDFEYPNLIGTHHFDDCFEYIAQETNTSLTLWSSSLNMGLEIWQNIGERQFNFVQLCTPPDRKSIAIEPVSCGINAFNTHDGLIQLAPSETLRAQCGVRSVFKMPT